MTQSIPNPFFDLHYETAIEDLGNDYYDEVSAAEFPKHILRFRNDSLLPLLGLNPESVKDSHFTEAFGKFKGIRPFLALRYHGYQFGEYNPYLGDGRGFLYGQVRGIDGHLYDFGTKGTGRTPYSRNADGRLTLKGGIREVLAAEALHYLGVKTSRCFSLIETGESLWRGDEPSPTRSSVMIRLNWSHIRFGTLERLHYIKRTDLLKKLLDHVIDFYYPEIKPSDESYIQFYAELVKRVAHLSAQWMAAGFCHGVLNTDNMSITGESFDYGPYAFISTYNPHFISAYFDYGGRYNYGNQPFICRLNLEMLQLPLTMVVSILDLETVLAKFDDYYYSHYYSLMLNKLGFELEKLSYSQATDLVDKTIQLLQETQIGYHQFFSDLAQHFNYGWREDPTTILENSSFPKGDWRSFRKLYHKLLNQLPIEEMEKVAENLNNFNPKTALHRTVIESVWEPIASEDNWEPFNELIHKIKTKQ